MLLKNYVLFILRCHEHPLLQHHPVHDKNSPIFTDTTELGFKMLKLNNTVRHKSNAHLQWPACEDTVIHCTSVI